jgi:hypothetical protein
MTISVQGARQARKLPVSVLSALGAVVLGMCLYHESIGQHQMVGLALGTLALIFLSAE